MIFLLGALVGAATVTIQVLLRQLGFAASILTGILVFGGAGLAAVLLQPLFK